MDHQRRGKPGVGDRCGRPRATAEALEPRTLLSGDEICPPILPRPSVGAGDGVADAVAAPSPAAPGTVAPAASAPLKTIEGINYDTSRFIPPDPNGAAGPGHVVSLVNANIQWHTKSGTLQGSQTLRAFSFDEMKKVLGKMV